jgi:hypothetical protein
MRTDETLFVLYPLPVVSVALLLQPHLGNADRIECRLRISCTGDVSSCNGPVFYWYRYFYYILIYAFQKHFTSTHFERFPLEHAKESTLFGLFLFLDQILELRRFVALGLGHGAGVLRTAHSSSTRPVERLASKDTVGLFLLVATFGVFLVRFEPFGLFGALDVTIVPGTSSLHVRDIRLLRAMSLREH